MLSLFAKAAESESSPETDAAGGHVSAAVSEGRWTGIRGFLVWTFGGGLFTRGAVLGTTLVAARALDPIDFGVYLELCAVALLAAGLWDLGVTALAVIELSGGRISTRAALARIGELRIKTAVLWFGILVAGRFLIERQRAVPSAALLWFVAYSLCLGASNVCASFLQARLAFRAAAFVSGAGRWVTALLSALALPAIGLASGIGFLGFAAFTGEAAVIALGLAALRYSRFPGSSAAPARIGADARSLLTIRRSIPFAANGLLAMVYNRLDVLIVGGLAPAGQLALYAPASRLQDALYMIPGSLQQVAFPIMSRAWNSENGPARLRDLVRRFTQIGFAISLPASILCCVFAPQLLALVLGAKYVEAATPVRILLWFLPLSAVSMPMLTALAASGRATETTKIFLVTAMAAIGMHLALDWRFGAVGGAWATLFRDPCALVATVVLARRWGCALDFQKPGWLPVQESSQVS